MTNQSHHSQEGSSRENEQSMIYHRSFLPLDIKFLNQRRMDYTPQPVEHYNATGKNTIFKCSVKNIVTVDNINLLILYTPRRTGEELVSGQAGLRQINCFEEAYSVPQNLVHNDYTPREKSKAISSIEINEGSRNLVVDSLAISEECNLPNYKEIIKEWYK